MPTGYTADVVDGKVTSFEEYAKQCMRAFVMHMRDDSWDRPYYPRQVNDYYEREAKNLEKEIAKLEKTDEKELWALECKRMESDIKGTKKIIADAKKETERINAMLKKAEAFVPPTEEHVYIKQFMIEQLKISMHEGDYWEERIKENQRRLKGKMPKGFKKELIKDKQESLERAKRRYAEEVASCKKCNDWCDAFLKAIKDKQ